VTAGMLAQRLKHGFSCGTERLKTMERSDFHLLTAGKQLPPDRKERKKPVCPERSEGQPERSKPGDTTQKL